MKRRNLLINIVRLCLLMALLFTGSRAHADQAQYFYDELGRLIGASDGSGNITVYSYDAVGNLLSAQRYAPVNAGIGVFFLSPGGGPIGAQVQIRGFGFSAVPSENQVAFNGKPTVVLSAAINSIIAIVPDDATTGPVTVTNVNGTASSPQPFTISVAPAISGMNPNRFAQGTTNFTIISGVNLAAATAITFSSTGLSAAILPGASSRSLPINVTVAPTTPVGSYTFSVTTPGGVAQSGGVIILVMPAAPAATIARLSVFMPPLANTAPSGPTFKISPLSIFMPLPPSFSPSGTGVVVAPPESVLMP